MLKESEIKAFIDDDKTSERKRKALVGEKYYNAQHDIQGYRMFYYNTDGVLVEDKSRANVKISHPFFTELIDQCVQYMLSGKECIAKSDNEELQKTLESYFDDDFMSELQEVLTDVKVKGFAYMYAYMNEDGMLTFKRADAMGVVECRAKETSDKCDYVIYYYTDRVTKDNKTITRIQVFDKDNTYYFVEDDKGSVTKDDSEKLNPRPHIVYHKPDDEAIYYDGFGFIPFFKLENNKRNASDLSPVKGLIDDYDMMSCGLSNNLTDFDMPLYVVKGFQGDKLDELQENLKTKKMIGTDDEGGVEVRTVEIPYQARLTKMQEDEKNIYRFGMGFNSAQIGDGNITNIVIKSRYALLDLKCNKLEKSLKSFLKKILKVILERINKDSGTAYKLSDVKFIFDREVMTNAQDNANIEKTKADTKSVEVNTIMSLSNVLDDETVIKQLCDVMDLDYQDVKDKLPDDPDTNLNNADTVLNNIVEE